MKRLDPILVDPAASRNMVLLNQELATVRKLRRVFTDASGGAETVYLPNGYDTDFDFFHIKTDSSGNAVTVTAFTGQTIEGSSTLSLATQYSQCLLTFHHGVWYRMDA